jgi:hypothetical protein
VGYQVIKQPGEPELYAVFSSFSDSWIRWNHTKDDVIGWMVERAAADARKSAERLFEALAESPVHAYYQFAMSFDEANAASTEHDGPDLRPNPGAGGVDLITPRSQGA